MDEHDEDFYETNQTVVAAYFVYERLNMVDLRWENGVCSFSFENTEELQKHLMNYVSGKARVEPQAFNNAFAGVRKRMFDAKEREI